MLDSCQEFQQTERLLPTCYKLDSAALTRRMDGVKARGGFAAAQAAGDLDGIKFTAGSVRAVAERIAKEQGEKARKAEADARLRADVADTDAGQTAAAAGRGGKKGEGSGKESRVSWKKKAADLSEKSAALRRRLRPRYGSSRSSCWRPRPSFPGLRRPIPRRPPPRRLRKPSERVCVALNGSFLVRIRCIPRELHINKKGK